jgi:hypothetical protein
MGSRGILGVEARGDKQRAEQNKRSVYHCLFFTFVWFGIYGSNC